MTLRYTALGGLGEVGMNCALFELEGKILVFDCGVSFLDDETLGVDHLAPDFTPILERASDVVGVLITHGHQDHIGALPLLMEALDVPVYLPRFAAGLVRHALSEAGFGKDEVELVEIKAGDRVKIGPFDTELIHVNHSIPDTLAVALHTPVGTVVHTADFKIDHAPYQEPPADLDRFRALGDQGVRVLFSDSTNILQEGHTSSESVVRVGLEAAVRRSPARAIVALFSTNMFRVHALAEIAAVTNRKLLLLGRSLQRNVSLARDLGVLKVPADVFVEEREARSLEPDELIIACTGSQAQPRAALARMAFEELAGFKIEPGDHAIFSARSIPGNEGAIARLQDQIVRRGGVVVTGGDVHCSGHACRDEQREMLEAVRPRTFVPVHGDHRFLVAHAALAAELGAQDTLVLDNGETIEVDAKRARRVAMREAGKVCVDVTPFGYLDGEAVRTRRRIAQRGLAVLTLAISKRTGDLLEDPTIENLGLFDEDFDGALLDSAIDAAEEAFFKLSERDRLDEERCSEVVRVAVMRFLRRETGRRPLVLPIIVYA